MFAAIKKYSKNHVCTKYDRLYNFLENKVDFCYKLLMSVYTFCIPKNDMAAMGASGVWMVPWWIFKEQFVSQLKLHSGYVYGKTATKF